MINIVLIFLFIFLSSCSSNQVQQDTINESISNINQNISLHDYDQAYSIFNSKLKNLNEIKIKTNQNGNMIELEISTVKLGNFLTELISFKNDIKNKCTFDQKKLESMLEESRSNLTSMGHQDLLNPKAETLIILKKCYESFPHFSSKFPHEYFHLKSSFSGKDLGPILGSISTICGKQNNLKSNTTDIITCFIQTQIEDLNKKIQIENDLFEQYMQTNLTKTSELPKDKIAPKSNEKNLSVDSLDGIKESYCFSYLNFQRFSLMKKKVDSGSIYGSGSRQEYNQLVFMINQSQKSMQQEAKRYFLKSKINLSATSCPKTTFAP